MANSYLSDLIAAAGDRLTRTERLLASAVLDDPTLVAFGTVSDLAQRVGTSRPSVVRFATKLGFEGYPGLQNGVREAMSEQLTRPSDRIRQSPADDSLAPARSAMESALAAAFSAVDEGRLARMADPLARARRVWVLSGETSLAGANALHSGLTIVRPGVHLVAEHAVAQDLAEASERDAAVVFDFARYRRFSVETARALVDRGVALVAVTDGPLSPLASLTETWCELEVPGIGPFDSSMPAVVVAELLVARVAGVLRDEARDRIDRTESMWDATGTFL